jgi:methyl-accepting chemotaxis protein
VVRIVKRVSDITQEVQNRKRIARLSLSVAKSVSDMSSAIGGIGTCVSNTADLARGAEASMQITTERVGHLEKESAAVEEQSVVMQQLNTVAAELSDARDKDA